MPEIALFNHAGCGNHGCEAIVRGTLAGLSAADSTNGDKDNAAGVALRLITNSAAQDRQYLGEELLKQLSIEEERHLDRSPLMHTLLYGYRKLSGDRECYLRYRFPMLFSGKNASGLPDLAISIGGDNYCYPEMVPELILADRMLADRGVPTALLGCSIEPDTLARNREMAEDLKGHRLITVRETLTYDALREAGIPKERLKLLPDPAFAMKAEIDEATMRDREQHSDAGIIGINVSPLIEQYRSDGGETALDAFLALSEHILKETEYRIAYIPHVVWENSDDRKPLRALQERFGPTGRTTLIEDHPAPVLKGIIAGCRFFIGARTHATIAAYSSLVPTLVIGYSVKSRGIARDLFGEERGLVLPVQELTGAGLIAAFEDLRAREEELRAVLAGKIPEYRERALENGAEMARLCRGGQ